MDLGRPPTARFPHQEVGLNPEDVSPEDLEYVVSRIGVFGDDNRAGIERTLHRISALRNRKGRIVGLTCRVGRAVFGTIGIIEDLVQSGKSLLLLGRPGVGKTTMLREVARVLADNLNKRVVIVDTSNEIAGDGDISHPAIGRARRMQVPTPTLQHAVMIEAVENHMPEVIIIDEIGTELGAMAARTIAERGVQLVATAHGNTLENLILNPTLSDLIGGIQTVTLGDEEARRRGTQKSILERKAPPTFDLVVEIQNWDQVAVHDDVATVVDAILRGQAATPQVRRIDETGDMVMEATAPAAPAAPLVEPTHRPRRGGSARGVSIYPFGINRARLQQAATASRLVVTLAEDPSEADAVITLRNHYRRRPQALRQAEASGVPVYVLKNNTISQMEQFLPAIANGASIPQAPTARQDPVTQALHEAEEAIGQVLSTEDAVVLSPQNAFIRRLQHQLAERYHLASRSQGKEPHRRVQIYNKGGRR